MDFGLSAPQKELYDRVLAFCRSRLNTDAAARRERHEFGVSEWRACGEFGLLGLSVPEPFSGMGLDMLSTALAIEAFGRGTEDAGLVFSASAHLFACAMPISEHASESLKQEFLPGLASGKLIGANAITEASAGSDVFALATRAVRSGEYYVLDGVKSYVTNGPVADVFLVYASTQPEHGYRGISAFIVRRDTAGLRIGSPFSKMGLTTSPVCSLYLEECKIPADHLVLFEGQGAAVFQRSMQWERACLFAGYLGAMERQLERAIAFASERRQFRRPIGKNQAISHRIANMKLRLESARLLLYRACWAAEQPESAGRDSVLDVSLAKLAVSEAAVQSGLDLIQIHGGAGYLEEVGVEHHLRDALPSTIFSGTSEVLRDLIASRIGL